MARKSSSGVPTLVRRQLGIRLKNHREKAGKTQEDAALGLLVHPTKIWRIETGRTAAKPGDVRELASIYGISVYETDDLLELSRGASQPGWTDEYCDVVPDSLSMYAGLEGEASSISSYGPELVPGLLQTRDYAREIINTAAHLPVAVRDKRLAFRLERQEKIFGRSVYPQMRFVIGEAAFRYQVGSPELIRAQIAHLVKTSARVDIRVRPFSAGLHSWMAGGSFAMLKFPDVADPEVIYIESHIEARYLETTEQVDRYAEIFEGLHRTAIPMKEFVP